MKKIIGWLLMVSVVVGMSAAKVMADVVSNPEEGVLWLEDFKTLTIDPGASKGWRLSPPEKKLPLPPMAKRRNLQVLPPMISPTITKQ